MTEPTPETDALALVTVANVPALFSSETALEAMLSAIEKAARAEVPDLTTAKGRKAIASLAYKVAQSKTALDAAGKALNDDARAKIDAVDAERRKVRDRLDKLRDEIRSPLTEWEAAEDARIAGLEARLAQINTAGAESATNSTELRAALEDLEAIEVRPSVWEEFTERAETAKADALRRVRFALDMMVEREAEAAEAARQRAENERLRAVIAAQEKAEADRLAAERAAEDARLAAERKAAEDQRLADEAAERERKAAADREAAAERARVEAEERAAAEAKAAQDAADAREAALKREVEEANARTARAAQAERDRLAAEAKAAEDARLKREDDAAHRGRIRADIVAALATMADAETQQAVADALMLGQIPHVQVML